MNSRLFRCSLVAIISSLTLPFLDAQVRLSDRMQTQPQAPSRWETAIHNAQEGRVSLGRRIKKDKPSSQAQPGLAHEQALAMPHWTSSFTSQGSTYPFTAIGSGSRTTLAIVRRQFHAALPQTHVSFRVPAKQVKSVRPAGRYIDLTIASLGLYVSCL
jgi:hypothetical protein